MCHTLVLPSTGCGVLVKLLNFSESVSLVVPYIYTYVLFLKVVVTKILYIHVKHSIVPRKYKSLNVTVLFLLLILSCLLPCKCYTIQNQVS